VLPFTTYLGRDWKNADARRVTRKYDLLTRHGEPSTILSDSEIGFAENPNMLNRLKRRLGPSLSRQIQGAITIPVVSLGDLLGTAKPEIHLTIQRYEDGMLPSEQAMALLAIVVATAPKSVLEIGTFMGHTTKLLAMNLPEAIIHSVDLPLDFIPEHGNAIEKKKDDFHLIAKRQVGREYRGTLYETRIRQHFADTAVWNFREAAGATLFFIDGSHTYDYCRNDSERCYELCRGKGVFLWHDCDDTHPGVVKFLLEWRALGRSVVRIEGTPIAYWNGNLG